jgi:hypothetical protein
MKHHTKVQQFTEAAITLTPTSLLQFFLKRFPIKLKTNFCLPWRIYDELTLRAANCCSSSSILFLCSSITLSHCETLSRSLATSSVCSCCNRGLDKISIKSSILFKKTTIYRKWKDDHWDFRKVTTKSSLPFHIKKHRFFDLLH